MSSWVVLRTSGRHTLRLVQSLAKDGFEVWTPLEERAIKNTKRKATLPLMPSYIFARGLHRHDLLRLMEDKRHLASHHVEFSLMRGPDHRIVGIADEHLQGLRTLEQKRAPRRRANRLPQGVQIRVKQEGGSFAGMVGKVIRSGEHLTLALLDSRMKVELPTFMFVENDIRDEEVVLSRAA